MLISVQMEYLFNKIKLRVFQQRSKLLVSKRHFKPNTYGKLYLINKFFAINYLHLFSLQQQIFKDSCERSKLPHPCIERYASRAVFLFTTINSQRLCVRVSSAQCVCSGYLCGHRRHQLFRASVQLKEFCTWASEYLMSVCFALSYVKLYRCLWCFNLIFPLQVFFEKLWHIENVFLPPVAKCFVIRSLFIQKQTGFIYWLV